MKKIIASAFLAAFALTANVQANDKLGGFASEEKKTEVVYSVGMTGVT